MILEATLFGNHDLLCFFLFGLGLVLVEVVAVPPGELLLLGIVLERLYLLVRHLAAPEAFDGPLRGA